MPDYVSTKFYDSCKNVHAVAEVIAENIETVVVVNKLKRQHGRPSEIILPTTWAAAATAKLNTYKSSKN